MVKSLKLSQEDIKLNGWAIECRINAEDVQAGFAPDPGRIENLSMPIDPYVRIDTGVQAGSSIVASYRFHDRQTYCQRKRQERSN